MSVQDATTVLNEDTGLFAFLPVANYVFLLIQFHSNALFVATILATLSSAMIYNMIAGEPDLPSRISLWVLRTVGVIWISLLVWSMSELAGYFDQQWIMPEVLFFISTSFLSLVLTDSVSRLYLDGYDSQL